MALTVSTDIMKYRESTSDPWKNLIIEPSGTTMYFPSQTVNVASNAEMFRITDGAITTQTVVVECTFASPSSITSDVTWTSYDGYIAFYGTCTSATTADVALGNATVPTPETPLSIAKGGTGASTATGALTNLGIAGSFTYSTTETETGQTWIDGKPIYRKVYNVTSSINGNYSFNLGLPTAQIGQMISMYGIGLNGGNYFFLCYPYNSSTLGYFFLSSGGYITGYVPFESSKTIFVFEYTKAS